MTEREQFLTKRLAERGEELERCREALLLAREWVMGQGYSGEVCVGLKKWIDAGMTGPLPEFTSPLLNRAHGESAGEKAK